MNGVMEQPQQQPQQAQQIPNPEMNEESMRVMASAQKLASKALKDSDSPKFTEGLKKDPVSMISGYATMYTTKAREAGLNDLAVIMVAGSLIITGMVNALSEGGLGEKESMSLQQRAMDNFVKKAIKGDRMQNGYTPDNTPPDENGKVPRENPETDPATETTPENRPVIGEQ